jgi:hemerythrin superfamily protein
MPSIYEAITRDHDRHRKLLATLADSASRRQAWDELYQDIKSHAAAEEETFYSKLISETWGQDAARHSVSEHKELDDLMEEMHEIGVSAPGWQERFERFRHDYEHHIDEEEDEVFTRARKLIDKSREAEFAERFEARKTEERGLIDKKREDSLED